MAPYLANRPRGNRMKSNEARLVKFRDHFEIEAPYNSRFIAQIKFDIPKERRSWEPKMKRWVIDKYSSEVGNQLEIMLMEFYEYVSVEIG